MTPYDFTHVEFKKQMNSKMRQTNKKTQTLSCRGQRDDYQKGGGGMGEIGDGD